jgi:propionyl-CoA synthetase
MIDAEGYVHILSRSDDIINVAAHRLSTGIKLIVVELIDKEVLKKFLPRTLASLSVVSLECRIPRKVDFSSWFLIVGHVPLAFITAKHISPSLTTLEELNTLVRKKVGAISSLAGVIILEKIPKTRSGKTLRRVLREIVEKGAFADWQSRLAVPATVEDPAHVDWAREKVKSWMTERTKAKAKL